MKGMSWWTVGVLALASMPMISSGQEQVQSGPKQPSGLFLQGDVALWTVAIKPDKTADFERVLARLRDALVASEKPERRQQAAGWKVIKLDKPMPDGNIGYVHIISPVVAGADYTLMQTLYDQFPDERLQLYELYKNAFAKNLALASGSTVIDMSAKSGGQ